MEIRGQMEPGEQSWLEAFILSTEDALTTMAAVNCAYRESIPLTTELIADRIYATMPVTGNATGYVGIAIYASLAAQVIAAVMGCNAEDIAGTDVAGGICELLNIIAGNTKARLKDTGSHFEITPPVEADAASIARQYISEPPGVGILFDVLDSSFLILVNLQEG